eukprot:GFUD01009400.1.p1 GENE.GFUD01009400.1~~GFUD01009400.1.p1  ORF type:complete len:262 (-),score=64.27 GFUD01009400.1:23-808(-)
MTSKYLVASILIISSSLISSLPAPQSSETSSLNPSSSFDYGDYGDYNAVSKAATPVRNNDLGDLLRTGSSLAQGFLALLGAKVNFFNTLMSDQEFRDQVSRTVSTGLNLTGQIAAVAVPLVRTAVSQAPTIINASRAAIQTLGSEENQARVRQVSQGVGLVASQAPELIGQGSRLAGSVIKAANDTAPLILDGIQEFTDQLPLITGFASAYAEVNAEQAQKVAQTFYTSLQCDLQCRDVVDKDLKQECLVQFCTKEDEDEV